MPEPCKVVELPRPLLGDAMYCNGRLLRSFAFVFFEEQLFNVITVM